MERLFDQFHTALEEAVEGLALEHAVLEQGQIDELVDNGVRLGVIGDDSRLLVLFGLNGFLGLGLLVFVFLSQFVVLLLILCSADGSQTGLLTLSSATMGLSASAVAASLSSSTRFTSGWSLLSTRLNESGI